jgi:hypothetical protein
VNAAHKAARRYLADTEKGTTMTEDIAPASEVAALADHLSMEWFAGRLDLNDPVGRDLRIARAVLAAGYVSPTQAAKDRAEASAAAWDEGWQHCADHSPVGDSTNPYGGATEGGA